MRTGSRSKAINLCRLSGHDAEQFREVIQKVAPGLERRGPPTFLSPLPRRTSTMSTHLPTGERARVRGTTRLSTSAGILCCCTAGLACEHTARSHRITPSDSSEPDEVLNHTQQRVNLRHMIELVQRLAYRDAVFGFSMLTSTLRSAGEGSDSKYVTPVAT